MKDNFSGHASSYAQFRPVYPKALYDHLLTLVNEGAYAWDCGCGNGQVAGVIADYFNRVVATDISLNQIELAVLKSNVDYRVMPAEKTDIKSGSINLVTVGQALHWFNFEEFYQEVKRVCKPDAILAVWCYNLLEINEDIDIIIGHFYANILGDSYWDPERKYIEEHYETIPFPFQDLESPEFKIEVSWNLDQLLGYLNSWSAVQHYIKKNGTNPLEQVMDDLKKAWGNAESHKVIFPIYIRIGKVNS